MISSSEISRLWNCHASGLRLLARVRCEWDAEDLVQEAFVRLSRQSDIPDDPLAWLATTVRHLAIDLARREGRRRRREKQFCESKKPWFEDRPATQMTASDIENALQLLSEEDREILVAHVWNELSFRQIANVFAVSSSTANRRYQAAIEQLASILQLSIREPEVRKASITQES